MYLPSMTASKARVYAEKHSQGRQLQQAITLSMCNHDLIRFTYLQMTDHFAFIMWSTSELAVSDLRCSGGLVPLFIRFRFVL